MYKGMTKDESGDIVSTDVHATVPAQCLEQIRTLACDAPSNELFSKLQDVAKPNLLFMACDSTHLCMNYETSHGRQKTAGSVVLRKIQNKFNKWTDTPPGLGPFIEEPPVLTQQESVAPEDYGQLCATNASFGTSCATRWRCTM